MFSILQKVKLNIILTITLSSANALNLEKPKILYCTRAGPLQNNKTSDKSKFEAENRNFGICFQKDKNTRVRIHQLFSRTFFVFFSKICNFECKTTSDWLNRTV